MRRILTIFTAALQFLFSGCAAGEYHILNDVRGDAYPNADLYIPGGFTYSAADVDAVEICWRTGSVALVQSGDAELSVSESGKNLASDAQMRHYLDGRTLRIQFCQSGASVHVKGADKALTVELPKGIDLSVYNTAADIRAESLEQRSVFAASFSGNLTLGAVAGGSVEISSSSGKISIDRAEADALKLDSASGSVEVRYAALSGELSCVSVSGALNFGGVSAGSANIATTSGGVEIGALDCPNTNISTTSGRLRLALPENGARLAFSTVSGGLKTALPYETVGDLRVFGDGGSDISVSSVSGNVEIR